MIFYDLIGDIHGHAHALKALLKCLGYTRNRGVWQQPGRQVIFLGDLIDRGPQQREVLRIVRSMIDEGHALAVMGNHEFNALAYATPDPEHPGEHLRRHTVKNRHQHHAFLSQLREGSAAYKDAINWFWQLPLYLDLQGLRVIHACWHPEHINVMEQLTRGSARLTPELLIQASRSDSPVYEAVETLLKGLEMDLPEGSQYLDKDGNPRTQLRVRWWDQQALTYRQLALISDHKRHLIPNDPVAPDFLPGYDQCKPVFFGHYWMTGRPVPLNDHIACLDYSVAARHGGKLCAYRWEGEKYLKERNFIWV
ncbi:metallophosphoesterase [Pokkaliibacter plantistimulans]|uniref:Metallophosphoesterase n=2 Tax=Pseudomonadota TaxID=1224 RepID=A0ABX5LZ55_9GAMM|nr:metallophosphoesterase [Pokkaliibacter plantistimulans]PPC74618.1 metallophosphoesterase [Pokkaliibacter plantistimulans]PXF31954.1 metallophosphoesterase [Pokkaliibacter plantistimulans]